MDTVGIAPTSQPFQSCTNLSQLSVQINGTERTRTVIVCIDSAVHTPFCHSPEVVSNFRFQIQFGI